jgi:hypothetical protein
LRCLLRPGEGKVKDGVDRDVPVDAGKGHDPFNLVNSLTWRSLKVLAIPSNFCSFEQHPDSQLVRHFKDSFVMYLLTLLAILPLLASAGFEHPPPFNRDIWRVGEVETIRFPRPPYNEYTVAIWQQSRSMPAATKGPTLFQKTPGGGPTTDIISFDWLVQVYDFDLELSNDFFLWLFEGGTNEEEHDASRGFSSSFFNITNDPRPVTTQSTVPSTSATTSSESSIIEQSTLASTTTSASPDTTTTTTSTTPSSTDTNGPPLNQEEEPSSSDGLSTGLSRS